MKQREIKFKIWDDYAKEWEKVVWINGDGVQSGISFPSEKDLNHLFTHYAEDGRYILCQSTGLLDKNGKEIYEGDILRPEFSSQHWEVRYVTNAFVGVIPEEENDLSLWHSTCEHLEVVGNIFEDSHLLEEH